MTEKLSKTITLWLIRHKAVSDSESEKYEYAAFLVIYTSYPIVIVSILGTLHGIPIGNSLLFAFTFTVLRKYAGGFHFHSKYVCLITSILIETVFLLLAKNKSSSQMLVCIYTISIVSLLVLSPVISKERSHLDILHSRCKRMVFYILAIISVFCYILGELGFRNISSYPEAAIIMTAVIQYPAILKKKAERKS